MQNTGFVARGQPLVCLSRRGQCAFLIEGNEGMELGFKLGDSAEGRLGHFNRRYLPVDDHLPLPVGRQEH